MPAAKKPAAKKSAAKKKDDRPRKTFEVEVVLEEPVEGEDWKRFRDRMQSGAADPAVSRLRRDVNAWVAQVAWDRCEGAR